MRIKSLHSVHGWRAVYPNGGNPRIAPIVFFAVVEETVSVRKPGEGWTEAIAKVIPLVPDDHDFGRELAPASNLGHYALLGPEEVAEPDWIVELTERTKR